MAIPYYLSDPFTDSDTDSDTGGVCVNENDARFKVTQKPTRNSNETLHEGHGDYCKCEKCGVRFLNVEGDYMGGGNGENDLERLFYCGKCRIEFKDKGELEGHMVEGSENVVCRECSHIVEALDLHWKQVHRPKPTIHQCPGCDTLFNTFSGITQHVESGQCKGGLSPSGFRELMNYENTPLAKKELPADILAGSTTTHTWPLGVLPGRVKVALAETSSGFKPEELARKGSASVLDHALPLKPADPPMEGMAGCWSRVLEAYVCPRLKCGKKFTSATALKDHLDSITHDKKAFRCPTCVEFFVSSSALLQHAESGACGVKQLIKGATCGLMSVAKKAEVKTG